MSNVLKFRPRKKKSDFTYATYNIAGESVGAIGCKSYQRRPPKYLAFLDEERLIKYYQKWIRAREGKLIGVFDTLEEAADAILVEHISRKTVKQIVDIDIVRARVKLELAEQRKLQEDGGAA